jgi:hypothetical protein
MLWLNDIELSGLYSSALLADGLDQQAAEAGPSGRERLDVPSKPGLPSYDQIMSLLPPDLNEELIKATWRKLPLKHRNQKEKLTQQLRQQFPRWRLQLRCLELEAYNRSGIGIGHGTSSLGSQQSKSVSQPNFVRMAKIWTMQCCSS